MIRSLAAPRALPQVTLQPWRWVAPALALFLTLPAILPFFQAGYWASDDGLFHLYRLFSLADAFAVGERYPRLFPDFAFGYGYPVLNFYAPLTYYVALVLHWLGLDLVAAMKATFALSYPLAALTIFRLARDLWDSDPGALLAAGIYTYLPYHLADVQLRGALAESWAFVWFPLILWAVLQRRPIWLALAGAALVLTHNLSVLLVAGALLFWLLAALRWPDRRGQPFSRWATWLLGGALALLLSAFYWVPVVAESRLVHLSLDLGGQGYQRHLQPLLAWFAWDPVYRYFPNQGTPADHPLPWFQWLLMLTSVLSMPFAWVQLRRGPRATMLALLAILALSLFLLTSGSTPLWRALPLLGMVQYPWRWLGITALATALLAGLVPRVLAGPTLPPTQRAGSAPALFYGEEYGESLDLEDERFDKDAFLASLEAGGQLGGAPQRAQRLVWTLAVAVPLLLSAVTLPGLPWKPIPVDPQAHPQTMWQGDFESQQIGATWTAEFLPLTVGEERWSIPRPWREATPPRVATGAVPAPDEGVGDRAAVRLHQADGWQTVIEVALERPATLTLHQFALPGWQATVDGAPAKVMAVGSLGLVGVALPAGTHVVELRWAPTDAVRLGVWLSGLGLFLLLGLWAFAGSRLGLVAAVLIFVGVALLSERQGVEAPPPLRPLEARLGDQANLLGWKPTPAPLSGAPLCYGAPPCRTALDLTLFWWNRAPTDTQYQVFIHLTSATSPIPVAQSDSAPGGGYTPTSRWLPGQLVPDPHHLVLPADLQPGVYELWAGLYDVESGARLPVQGRDDGRVPLGRITID